MLKLMYKWTNNFEDSRDEFERMLSGYLDKLVIIKSTKDLNLDS